MTRTFLLALLIVQMKRLRLMEKGFALVHAARSFLCVLLPINFFPSLQRPPTGLSSLYTEPRPGLLSTPLALGVEY